MPSRWLKGGKGLSKFRADMINDELLAVIYDFADAGVCFGNIHIEGGICYFRWDNSLKGEKQNVHYNYQDLEGNQISSNRNFSTEDLNNIIRDSRQISIVSKMKSFSSLMFDTIVSARNPFGLYADLFNQPDKYPEIILSQDAYENSLCIFGVKGIKGGAKRIIKYCEESAVKKGLGSIKKYKILFSKAYMTTSTVPPELILGAPKDVCTETFLKIGDFDTKYQMLCFVKYIKSKFFRALLFFNRSSLNISQGTFPLIPMQDFTENSDIDWSKSVEEIDKQLYEKYHLSNEEITFIETMIKPM